MLSEKPQCNSDHQIMSFDPLDVFNLNSIDDMDYMTDCYLKGDADILHDCMWSGSCDKDKSKNNKTGKQCTANSFSNCHHWNNGKWSDSGLLFSSPLLTNCSFFDMFTIGEEENSLDEIDDYDDDDDLLGQLSGDSSDERNISTNNSLINDHSYDSTHANQCKELKEYEKFKFGKTIKDEKLNRDNYNETTFSNKSKTSKEIKRCSSNTAGSIRKNNINVNISNLSAKSQKVKQKKIDINSIGVDVTNNHEVTISKNNNTNSLIANSSVVCKPLKAKNPKSLYPERRKEHNNSEKKRRDHLRNAFNCLKDQIPKLKDNVKKAARVTILKEATSYVTLLKDKHRYLERTKNVELVKKENLLKKLKLLQNNSCN